MTLIDALRSYKQADEAGVMVLVSRQACDEAANEIQRLRAALEVCSADWISAPGTVMGAAQGLSAEFRRRMEIAAAALAEPSTTRLVAV